MQNLNWEIFYVVLSNLLAIFWIFSPDFLAEIHIKNIISKLFKFFLTFRFDLKQKD